MKNLFTGKSLVHFVGYCFLFMSLFFFCASTVYCEEQADFFESIQINSYYALGLWYQNRGRYNEAIKEFRKVLERNPDYLEAHYQIALIYEKKRDIKRAIDEYQKILETRPDEMRAKESLADIYNKIGESYLKQGVYEEALEKFNRAVEINPSFGKALYNIAEAQFGQENYGVAAETYKKVLELQPDYPGISDKLKLCYLNLGTNHYENNRSTEALVNYEKALSIEPNCVEVLLNIGLVYQKIGNCEKAINTYEKIVELSPNHAEALYSLATIYYNEDLLQKAAQAYKKLLESAPGYLENIEACYTLGLLCHKLGMYDDAIKLYKRVSNTNPGFKEVSVNLRLVQYYKNLEFKNEGEQAIADFLCRNLRGFEYKSVIKLGQTNWYVDFVLRDGTIIEYWNPTALGWKEEAERHIERAGLGNKYISIEVRDDITKKLKSRLKIE